MDNYYDVDAEINEICKKSSVNVGEIIRCLIAFKEATKIWANLPDFLLDDVIARQIAANVFVNVWRRRQDEEAWKITEYIFKRLADTIPPRPVAENKTTTGVQ